MIRIRFLKLQDFITLYEVEGHSGFEKAGQDIVCAAVSALTQTTVLGLNALGLTLKVKRRDGYLKVEIPIPQDDKVKAQAQAVTDTMRLGLKDLQKGYHAFIELEE